MIPFYTPQCVYSAGTQVFIFEWYLVDKFISHGEGDEQGIVENFFKYFRLCSSKVNIINFLYKALSLA